MRIVIDIDGDQVRVHRVIGDEPPPAALLEKAAALNAESAGIAMVPGGVASLGALAAEPGDAGRGPSSARGARKAARAGGSKRSSGGRRVVTKQRTSRRGRR